MCTCDYLDSIDCCEKEFGITRDYNLDETKDMKDHVKSLIEKDIIEPTESGYAATSIIIHDSLLKPKGSSYIPSRSEVTSAHPPEMI